MADYLAPFHMPEFSNEEFKKKKAEYVKEHGYSITLPKFRDIIHIGLHRPMTEEEKILWYSGRKHEIGRSRLLELYYQKERARERYQKMLASPIPNWASSYTSILTAADDAQDAITTLGFIGRIFCKILPKFLARLFLGPVGLLWMTGEIISILMMPAACLLNPMGCKRGMKKKFMRRAKGLKAGLKGYARSGKFLPSFSEGIQALQVTKDIWGIGISIGPIFGAAYDLISGGIRWLRGQKVVFKDSPSDVEVYDKAADTMHRYARWKRPKKKMTKAEFLAWKKKKIEAGTWGVKNLQHDAVHQAMRLNTTFQSFPRRTDFVEETFFYGLAEIAGQGIKITQDYWDPLKNIEGLEHIEIEAYNNPNPLIEEMLREEGVDPEAGIGWPSLGKRWATYEELQASIAPIAAGNFEHFVETSPDKRLNVIAEQSAIESGLHAIARLEGQRNIKIQYCAPLDVAETLLDKGYSFPLTITQEQLDGFALWLQALDDTDIRPTLREILDYAKNSLGFEFTTTREPI